MRAWGVVLLGIVVLPGAAAESYVHSRLSPAEFSLSAEPGSRHNLEYEWHVDFENTTCPSDPKVGLDFFPESSPIWVGESFIPDRANATPPSASGKAILEVALDEDAPRGEQGLVHLATDLKSNSADCTPPTRELMEGATLVVQVAGTADLGPTNSHSGGAKRTPAPSLVLAMLVCVIAAQRPRR